MFENLLEKKAVAFPSHCFIHTDRFVGMRLTGSDMNGAPSLSGLLENKTHTGIHLSNCELTLESTGIFTR